MKFSVLTATILASVVNLANAEGVTLLTEENYDTLTAGKAVFIKFFAPWCGACKMLAPTWEQLAAKWEDSEIGLIAEIDCTSDEAGDLCQENSIEGYPTILYGDPSALSVYTGNRGINPLSKFATKNLKPFCSMTNLDACDEEEKAQIAKIQTMTLDEMDDILDAVEEQLEANEDLLEAGVKALQEELKRVQQEQLKLKADHDEGQQALKKKHMYGAMRYIYMQKDTETDDKEEL